MSPNELADLLEFDAPIEGINKEAAAMLRQQQAEIEALKDALSKVITISDRKHDAWDRAKELLEAKRMVAYSIGYEDATEAAKQ